MNSMKPVTKIEGARKAAADASARVAQLEADERAKAEKERAEKTRAEQDAARAATTKRHAEVFAKLASCTLDERIAMLDELANVQVPGHSPRNMLTPALSAWRDEEQRERDRLRAVARRPLLLAEAFAARDAYVGSIKPIRFFSDRMIDPSDVVLARTSLSAGDSVWLEDVQIRFPHAALVFVSAAEWPSIRDALAGLAARSRGVYDPPPPKAVVTPLEGDERWSVGALATVYGVETFSAAEDLLIKRIACARWLSEAFHVEGNAKATNPSMSEIYIASQSQHRRAKITARLAELGIHKPLPSARPELAELAEPTLGGAA